MATNVLVNTAVAFAAMNDKFSRGKSNGTTTIILFKKGSVGVCRVMCRLRRSHATDLL